jgi:hypothetical protein
MTLGALLCARAVAVLCASVAGRALGDASYELARAQGESDRGPVRVPHQRPAMFNSPPVGATLAPDRDRQGRVRWVVTGFGAAGQQPNARDDSDESGADADVRNPRRRRRLLVERDAFG